MVPSITTKSTEFKYLKQTNYTVCIVFIVQLLSRVHNIDATM